MWDLDDAGGALPLAPGVPRAADTGGSTRHRERGRAAAAARRARRRGRSRTPLAHSASQRSGCDDRQALQH
eukprot:2575490-Prymnesium_polylepis.1